MILVDDEDEEGILSPQDFHNAQNITFIGVATQNEISFNNLNDSSIFEGDIEVDETDNLRPFNSSLDDIVSQVERIWNTRNGPFVEIPYTIPNGITDHGKAEVARAIFEFRSKTCVK